MVLVKLTVDYYQISTDHKDKNQTKGLTQLLYIAHQKSIDYRLQARGPRRVSPNLAMLTVDERAVATIGRWPWPRSIIARAVDNAFNYGAKVMAFDISFAESSVNPAQEVLAKAQSESLANPELETTLTQLSPLLDNDEALGAVFTKHADKIVAGSFSTATLDASWAPETEFCRDLIFKRTPVAQQWDREEILLSVADPTQAYMPASLSEIFGQVLSQREEEVRKTFGEPKSKNEQVRLENEVQAHLHEACDTILDDLREPMNEYWSTTILPQENPKEFTFPNYDAWLADYRSHYRSHGVRNAVPYAIGWNLNTPVVAKGTKHTGFFNAELDADGTIRSKGLILRTGNSYFPAISLKAYLLAHNYNAAPRLEWNPATALKEVVDMEITNNDTGERVFSIPTDGEGKLLINYAGPQKMFPYLSFADLVTDSPEADIEQRTWDARNKRWQVVTKRVQKAEFLKDKIFVVGATAMGIYDLRVTPFEENFPGAETHLNVIDNLIQRSFFRPLPDERVYMPLILGAVGLILTIALSYLGAVWGLALTGALLIGTVLYDKYVLFNKGIVVTIIWPIFLIGILYVVLTFYRYLTEERGKKELRQTFQKYVSPAIVEEILSDPQNIELGGKKVNLTVFFSDVRGFTTISEKLDPRALSDLLNSYLTPMTEIVFRNRGTLDKYMGDAIMAFFGAPIHYPDHAKFACRCALQSLNKLFELQKEFESKGLPTIDIGIGLNTGEVSVGNMGSETVRSYTVMGDAVNLASRLEGINKQYGTRIILSEMTYNEVKDNFVCREVDWVRVKGKALPVKIYELIAEGKVPSPTIEETMKWFGEGYEFYHSKSWQKGLECFSKALDLNPTDEVSKLYIQRCQDYLAEPPEEGWDGVFVMKTK